MKTLPSHNNSKWLVHSPLYRSQESSVTQLQFVHVSQITLVSLKTQNQCQLLLSPNHKHSIYSSHVPSHFGTPKHFIYSSHVLSHLIYEHTLFTLTTTSSHMVVVHKLWERIPSHQNTKKHMPAWNC